MALNENDFMNGGMLEEETGEQKPYVPKFEQDLKKAGGSLSALAQQRRAEQENTAETAPEAYAEEEAPNAEAPRTYAEPKVQFEEEDIDYVYDNEVHYSVNGTLEEDISADNIQLDEMDVKLEEMRTDKNSMISSIKNQMMVDDLAMSIDERPQLDEMSDKYGPSKKKEEDILAKSVLARDEKELIKNRLKAEIESKPEGYDKRKSAEMYKQLMAEQKAREAKSGFVQLAVTAVLGIISAAFTYILHIKAPEASGLIPAFNLIALGALVFALFMLIKAKFSKTLSVTYFTVYTVALIVPGLIVYITDPDSRESSQFIMTLVLYGGAILFGAATAIRLVMSKKIAAYYSYKPEKKSKRR